MNPQNNSLDATSGMGYNTSNNDIYEAVVDQLLLQPQVVKMDEQKPVNDVTCRHETLVPDENDRIGNAVMHMCANPKCGVGFYIKI